MSRVTRNTLSSRNTTRRVVSSAPATAAQQAAVSPSYVDELTTLLGTVQSTSQGLAVEQRNLQQQALDIQSQQLADAQNDEARVTAQAEQANRESYVSLLQAVLLNT